MTEVRASAPDAPSDIHVTVVGQASPPTIGLVGDADARLHELLGRMTREEKLAQIVGYWEKVEGEAVAPLLGEFDAVSALDEFARNGLGHLTRVYGTRPVDPVERAAWL
jgi:beta-glucosidase